MLLKIVDPYVRQKRGAIDIGLRSSGASGSGIRTHLMSLKASVIPCSLLMIAFMVLAQSSNVFSGLHKMQVVRHAWRIAGPRATALVLPWSCLFVIRKPSARREPSSGIQARYGSMTSGFGIVSETDRLLKWSRPWCTRVGGELSILGGLSIVTAFDPCD